MSRDALCEQAARVLDESIASISTVYERIDSVQNQIEAKRSRIALKAEALRHNKTSPVSLRIAESVRLDLREELVTERDTTLEDLRTDFMHILNYIQALHRERPELELCVQTPLLLVRLSGFPSNCPPAKVIIARIRGSKVYQRSLLKESTSIKPISSKTIEPIFLGCESIFDSQLGFFPPTAHNETAFSTAIDSLSPEFHRVKSQRISRCIYEPHNVGAIILEQCADLIKALGLEKDSQRYLFLLFCRLFFDSIYVSAFAGMRIPGEVFEFQSRIVALRKLTPIAFGDVESHFPGSLASMRLCDFPDPNPYSVAMGQFLRMNFALCPIDFCVEAKAALESTQETASRVAYDSNTKRTGQVLARTDHLLSLDELFDVSLVVFLLSDPLDILTLIRAFDPFLPGLQMPSALGFAFSHMKAICEHIARLDMKAFLSEAKERIERDEDVDPLNIIH
jgi:hypothetical protein